jgi:hypothetical protein
MTLESLDEPLRPRSEVRRDFLKKLSLAGSAALMTGQPQFVRASDEASAPKATADACIVLWMGGGMAAPDTFDPKRYSPFKDGLEIASMLSTFPAIDTAVDNIKVCRDGPRHADSQRSTTGSGQHSTFAAPIPLAHRLRATADGCLSAHRRLDG